MAKKTKGKQKDQARQPPTETPPSITLGSPAIPELAKTLPKINTAVGHTGGALPMTGHIGRSLAPADDWSTAQDNWASHDAEERGNDEEEEEEEEEDWNEENADDAAWGEGTTGSATHTSPATGASPALGGGWGREDDSAWNVAGGGLASAIGKAFGFGGHPDRNEPNSGPELKRKSTLKRTPPAAPAPPASKHVAFGVTHLHPSAGAARGGPPPPPPPPPPTGAPKVSTTSSPHQMNHPMRERSHSQPAFANGWGPPHGSGGVPNPGVAGAQAANHPALQAYLRARANSALPSVPADPRMVPTMPAQAWTQWGKGKDGAMPQVATAIAANIPTSTPAYAYHTQTQPAADAALSRAALLQQHAQLSAQLQQAKLQELLNHPAQHKGQPVSGLHRQMPGPADPARSPAWPEQQQKKTWPTWAAEHQIKAAQGDPGYGQPQRPPQQMQVSESWESHNWHDVGQGRGNGTTSKGWGDNSDHGGQDEWPKDDGGDWSSNGHAGGGWPSYGAEGESEKKRSRKSDRERGRGRSEKKKNDGGWDQNDDSGWGRKDDGGWGKKDDSGWSTSNPDAGWNSNGGGVWGQSKGDPGKGETSKKRGEWTTIHEEDENEYNEEDEEQEEYDDLDDMYTDPGTHHRHPHPQQDKHDARDRRSYEYRSPGGRSQGGYLPATAYPTTQLEPSVGQTSKPIPQLQQSLPPKSEFSRTMNFASGRMDTLFDLKPPLSFHWGGGAGMQSAERALFGSDKRLARERIHWGFNPDKDQRVSTLMAWIDMMSGELVMRGLQKFFETRQRGALIANADFRDISTGHNQPTFDWITLDNIHDTLDKNLQKYVVSYKPASHVLVFVFLLSKTGNSLAIWRKKLTVPQEIFEANAEIIEHTLEMQERGPVVYIDEKDEPEPPPVPPKKKGIWRRIFSIFKSKKSKSLEGAPA